MIYYLLDFFINNLGIYTSSLILIRLEKMNMLYILLIDVFINKIPIIFISLFIIKYLNKYLRNLLTRSFFVDNIIYFFDYLIFMTIIFIYKNNNFIFINLLQFYIINIFANYFLFLLLKNKY